MCQMLQTAKLTKPQTPEVPHQSKVVILRNHANITFIFSHLRALYRPHLHLVLVITCDPYLVIVHEKSMSVQVAIVCRMHCDQIKQ